jgi:hypothetical protein
LENPFRPRGQIKQRHRCGLLLVEYLSEHRNHHLEIANLRKVLARLPNLKSVTVTSINYPFASLPKAEFLNFGEIWEDVLDSSSHSVTHQETIEAIEKIHLGSTRDWSYWLKGGEAVSRFDAHGLFFLGGISRHCLTTNSQKKGRLILSRETHLGSQAGSTT